MKNLIPIVAGVTLRGFEGMRQNKTESSQAPTLNNIINDSRLSRLFQQNRGDCALQLWVLQIKLGELVEIRIVYGRVVPHSFSNNMWSATDDDNFHDCGQFGAQVVQLNLYLKSTNCIELLRLLAAGKTVTAISEELGLNLKDKLRGRFGTVALNAEHLAFRPAAYLFNRDAHDRQSLSSPHGAAGAISAAITQTDKEALFRQGETYNVALARLIVADLDGHTGLDFGGVDAQRIGDIELLVFPSLNDSEQSLLSVSWVDEPVSLNVRFNPTQLPGFSGFLFRLSIETGGQITDSWISVAKPDTAGVYQVRFNLTEEKRSRVDSTEIEIFGFDDGEAVQGTLCHRWRVSYVREINFSGHALGHQSQPVKFDWLEKTAPSSSVARTKAALTHDTGNHSFESQVGGREADPWVPANRNLTSLFSRLHPAKSEGKFFLRFSEGDRNGRLEFVEWFKRLLAKYQNHQIVIFDPYFEDAGLGLLLLGATSKSEYIVFTSLPKPKNTDELTPDEDNIPRSGRIDNLIASCEQSRHLIQHLKLRIFGLKDGRLHDRYILVIAPDGLAAAGYHLSNSLQKAAENYPLLITPIPSDTLVDVEKYASGLVLQAKTAQVEDKVENPTFTTLFESKAATPVTSRVYDPLRFLERHNAGDVISVWIGEESLRGLSGDRLKNRMIDLGLVDDGKFLHTQTDGLRNCIDHHKGQFSHFAEVWDVLGDVMAHSHYQDQSMDNFENENDFLQFLADFVKAGFSRVLNDMAQELTIVAGNFFRDPLETILHSPYRLDHFVNFTRYTGLTWAEVFAIKFLWLFAPDRLRILAEVEMAVVPEEVETADPIKLLLLSQIVGEIAQSAELGASEAQRTCLLHSKNGFLRWIGLNSIEKMLGVENERAAGLEIIATFSLRDQVQTLGWMIARAAKRDGKADFYEDLLLALQKALPNSIQVGDLRNLVDSMRGHMRSLGWAEPWLFQDVIFPLLKDGRASADDACEIWITELVGLLAPDRNGDLRLFNTAREGQMTNTAAFLFANSGQDRQHASLQSLKNVLARQKRILQQPLASTSNWTRWHTSLITCTWILGFTRWSQYYSSTLGTAQPGLDQLSDEAYSLVKTHLSDQRQSGSESTEDQIIAFINEAEKLLDGNKDLEKESPDGY